MNRFLPKHNPFRASRQESVPWISPDGTTVEQLIDQLQTDRRCSAIVGPKGTGKTTLSLALQTALESRGQLTQFVTLSEDRKNQRRQLADCGLALAESKWLLVDGAERLPFGSKCLLFNRSRTACRNRLQPGGFIVTLHRRSLLIPTLYRSKTDVELLVSVLHRMESADDDTVDTAKALFAVNRGNIRLVLRALYNHHAHRQNDSDVGLHELAGRKIALESSPSNGKNRGQYAQR